MSTNLVAFVGSYHSGPGGGDGGIHVVAVDSDGAGLALTSHAAEPREAGYLVYAATTRTLYSVDERKTDGRGPVHPRASVHALRVDQKDGSLTPLNTWDAPAPRPTFLSVHEPSGSLLCANHGDFQHVERVIRDERGGFDVEYVYDDSSLILYGLGPDGELTGIRDLHVFDGHGPDPNGSPQNDGHAQASSHAHCAVLDPTGRYVVVCDKGTDTITVFALGPTLAKVSELRMPPSTGPRHIAFAEDGRRAFATCEFSSEVASFDFDAGSGELVLLSRVSTVVDGLDRVNEPAEIRVAPGSGLVYVNNRGEDSLTWFTCDARGALERAGRVSLSRSLHPGLAARSFAFDPTGQFLLVADRPANLIRSFRVDDMGSLFEVAVLEVPDPAFIEFARLAS